MATLKTEAAIILLKETLENVPCSTADELVKVAIRLLEDDK